MSQIFINVGALTENGERIKTKKLLKELVEEAWCEQSNAVWFDQTALVHSSRLPGVAEVMEIPVGVVLNVVGPDPYKNRKWYAEVYFDEVKDRMVVK